MDASAAEFVNDNADVPLIEKGKSWVSVVDGNGTFVLDGTKVIDLPSGTYHFNDFTLSGQSVLNISGDTTIYVTGNMERAGGTTVNNNTQIASNLKFMMDGGTANITSNNEFHGVIYAPNTHVTLDGDTNYFGAVVGKTLTVTRNTEGHYEEALDLTESGVPRRTSLVD